MWSMGASTSSAEAIDPVTLRRRYAAEGKTINTDVACSPLGQGVSAVTMAWPRLRGHRHALLAVALL